MPENFINFSISFCSVCPSSAISPNCWERCYSLVIPQSARTCGCDGGWRGWVDHGHPRATVGHQNSSGAALLAVLWGVSARLVPCVLWPGQLSPPVLPRQPFPHYVLKRCRLFGQIDFKGILERGKHITSWGEESWADEWGGTGEGKNNYVGTCVEYFPKCFNVGNFFLKGMVLNQRKMGIHNCGIQLWTILRASKIYLEI